MNKKQLVCMWIGITVFLIIGYFGIHRDPWERLGENLSNRPHDYVSMIIGLLCTVLVTSGLIITLRDKKQKNDKTEN